VPHLRLLSSEEAADKAHSKLTKAQCACNCAASTALGVAFLALSAATMGAPLLIQAAASCIPIPVVCVAPSATKNTYYTGYQHDRADCHGRRGHAPNVTNGCFVWSLLSFRRTNRVRVSVYGGGVVRAVFEALGCLRTGLESRAGVLLFWLESVDDSGALLRLEVPVHHQDGVQYVASGPRPRQLKYHVTVVGDAVRSAVLKHDRRTLVMGVEMPEKRLCRAQAEACTVHFDGSSGPNAAWLYAQPTACEPFKRGLKQLDPERVNCFKNKGERMEQPAGAAPGATMA